MCDPPHKIQVLNTYVQMHLIISQADVYTKARGLNVGLGFYLRPIFMCACSKAPGKYLHMRTLVCAFADCSFDKYINYRHYQRYYSMSQS